MKETSEQLPRDPWLLILPSGRKVSARGVREFNRATSKSDASVQYDSGTWVFFEDFADGVAFGAALNTIGIYVGAPTLKGDDADGDGKRGE